MQEKHTIVTSGETAGEDLKAELDSLKADIEDVVKAEVSLTVEVTEDEDFEVSEPEDAVQVKEAKTREKPNISVPSLNTTTKMFHFLQLIREHGPVKNDDLIEISDYGSASGTTNELWDRGLIDRKKPQGERYYVYQISDKGKQELAYHKNSQ